MSSKLKFFLPPDLCLAQGKLCFLCDEWAEWLWLADGLLAFKSLLWWTEASSRDTPQRSLLPEPSLFCVLDYYFPFGDGDTIVRSWLKELALILHLFLRPFILAKSLRSNIIHSCFFSQLASKFLKEENQAFSFIRFSEHFFSLPGHIACVESFSHHRKPLW